MENSLKSCLSTIKARILFWYRHGGTRRPMQSRLCWMTPTGGGGAETTLTFAFCAGGFCNRLCVKTTLRWSSMVPPWRQINYKVKSDFQRIYFTYRNIVLMISPRRPAFSGLSSEKKKDVKLKLKLKMRRVVVAKKLFKFSRKINNSRRQKVPQLIWALFGKTYFFYSFCVCFCKNIAVYFRKNFHLLNSFCFLCKFMGNKYGRRKI